jgi:predicted dehydrogenase
MAPIRVAVIGLSSSAKTSWAAIGHLPYLTSPRGKTHYEIVALLNSSIKAAEAAKLHFGLPPSVRAYGDPEALAADPDIDLIVCNTRSDTHISTTEPSLRAGKTVYMEWPLAENLAAASKLIGTARFETSIIGLQTRVSPVLLKLKELLASGKIGRVLSSDVRAHSTILPRDALPEGLAYFADRKIGGNPIAIGFAHMIDYVHNLLGEFESFDSRMQVQRPWLSVLGNDGAKISTVSSDVPDLLTLHGKLAKGPADIVDDATLSVTWRSGPPFKGSPGMVWTIYGEKGELRVTSPSGPYIELDLPEPITIDFYEYAIDAVTAIDWDWEEWQKELPVTSRMVGEVYERYAHQLARGNSTGSIVETERYALLPDGLARMKTLDTLFTRFNTQNDKSKV